MSVMSSNQSPEVGLNIAAGGIATNYHDQGSGFPVLLIHGSGPGVTAWANWRLVIPELSKKFRVVAPDIVGFGYTERPAGVEYGRKAWLRHLVDFMDALGLEKVDLVGNSFGGSLALFLATEYPERVRRIVLMGSVGVNFELTPGLDAVWGYEPSIENMKELLRIFAYDHQLVNDDLAKMRYEASVRPGYQEAFSQMFPAPRQQGVDALTVDINKIGALQHKALIVHGQEDRVIPVSNSHALFSAIQNAELHIFKKCGHWVQIEHSKRFVDLVEAFLA